MRFLSAKAQLTLGLVSLLVSVLCGAMLFGFVPEQKSAIMNGRAELCESVAVFSSHLIGEGKTTELSDLLTEIVKRNPSLLSAAIRTSDGRLVTEIGEHQAFWTQAGIRSTENEVLVPVSARVDTGSQSTPGTESVSAGSSSSVTRWGNVEMRFAAVSETGFAAFLKHPWVRMTIFIAGISGVVFYFYLRKMLKNLDPSKAVPKRVRAALDSLAEGLLVLDRKGRIVLANQAFSEWVDVPAEKLTGAEAATFGWVMHGTTAEGSFPWVEAIQQETAQAGVMIGLSQPGKPVQNLIANASPVLGFDGKYGGVLVSFDDVTQLEETRKDLKAAKEVAEDAQQQAETANKAKSEFLARMSHEIRTPMNAILGYTDVLRNGFDTTINDRSKYLNTIHASGEHLLAIINDILDLSKIESGQMELDKQRHSVHDLISQVLSIMEVKASEKSIRLRFEASGLVPETILTDAVRFRQAIFNLVGNAVKFTEKGEIRIVVGLNDDGLLKVDVIDTGIGISADAIDKIFERFTQANTSIGTSFGGTGLGLSISRQLARMMGGEICVSSISGKGSTFTLTVDPGPLKRIPLVDPTIRHNQPANEIQATRPKLPPCHILIVDDEPANRRLAAIYIAQAGGTFAEAADGEEAIRAATSGNFDAILMDFNMPVLGGLAATKRLREFGHNTPVIALTANVMQDDKAKALAAGCDGFLTKPIRMDDLINELNGLLSNNPAVAARHQKQASILVADPTTSTWHETQMSSSANHIGVNRTSAAGAAGPLVSSLPTDIPAFRDIVEEFVPRLRTRVVQLRSYVDSGEFLKVRENAHWLAGSVGTVGFEALMGPARELEAAALARNYEVTLRAMVQVESLVSLIQVRQPVNTPELAHS